tara:strand:+ start:9458 stop:9718 length:261 start_codon:yes stop_codon:yes gene_type:complete
MSEKTQRERFEETARQLECDEDEEKFNADLKKIAKAKASPKVCPECGHVFKGNGWDGIDAHWKAKHEDIMPYEDAWPLLKAGTYNA